MTYENKSLEIKHMLNMRNTRNNNKYTAHIEIHKNYTVLTFSK